MTYVDWRTLVLVASVITLVWLINEGRKRIPQLLRSKR